MRIDNFYFVVENIEEAVAFYSALLDKRPTRITEDRWADWQADNGQVYFGIISKAATETELVRGNNGVLGLYTSDVQAAYKKCIELNAKILYEPEAIVGSKDHYQCFALKDLDGNKIETAYLRKRRPWNFLLQ